ncbi:MAG TPA: Gfo/Idh/MocA family oxidoreductase [Roseiflexaceae bacterium]|nr:Gfo/Idh/MocA family oxidoreductase [Roseiflexaceae bacterium]
MRVGIAGAGSMGRVHAGGWAAAGATVAGFLGGRSDAARTLAAQYGARVYPDAAALLADVDVVDICTPTDQHAELALAAAAAGRQIVCEKPLARTLDEGRAVLAACRAAGVRLLVAHVVRFFPEYALARARVAEGAIGRPAVLRLARGSYRPARPQDNWFVDQDRSGGLLLDLMIHDYDYARWVAGEVTQVYARHVAGVHPDASLDYGLAILTHASGAITHVAGSWAYPPPTFRAGLEIAGETGLIACDTTSTEPLELLLAQERADAPAVALPPDALGENPYTTQIRSFYETLTHGRPTRVTAEDGLAALQIGLAAVESARTGRAVRLEPLPEVAR